VVTDSDRRRFEVTRPEYLADEYWESIEVELVRLNRSLDAGDQSESLGNLKCLAEAVGKVALDIAGKPAAPNASVKTVISEAHEVLRAQPGHELTFGTPFANIAMNASKMAAQLAEIRNTYGGGHGKARQPRIRDEMVDLTLDGTLTWVRWAVRRLGLFSKGQPTELIRDLIVEHQSFYKGDLAERLHATGLSRLEDRHQRAIGIAVGQRSAQLTFNVYLEGVRPAETSADLDEWTPWYRLGVAQGLLQNPDEIPTATLTNIVRATAVLLPVEEHVDEVSELVDQALETFTAPVDLTAQAENIRENVRDLQRHASKSGPNRKVMEGLVASLRERSPEIFTL
jgi:hypothetical protein